ncbi:MAG TPA: single-stranded DNA-binding protein [Pseudonocardiaceae bacterium]|jgi:single-strand DNA-binding protein
MNEPTMTICGNVVDTPKINKTKGGHVVANFRVASTPRRLNRDTGAWSDGDTLYITVTAWRALAENVAHSLQKGQPVIVAGRFCQREYTKDERVRIVYELEATSVGHDLNRGTASFEKVTRSYNAPSPDLDEQGIPADRTADYLDLDDEVESDVDVVTGEVRELATAS